jgi:hypothetical protein
MVEFIETQREILPVRMQISPRWRSSKWQINQHATLSELHPFHILNRKIVKEPDAARKLLGNGK